MVRKMFVEDKILIGGDVYLLPKMANRHGLIAGATGTGKTITLKTLTESFSDMGVPVLSLGQRCSKKFQEKHTIIFLVCESPSSTRRGGSIGQKGLPVRVTLSEMGPALLSKILNLTEAQSGVLNIVFKIADEKSLLIIDIKDLKSMINYVVENKEVYEPQYGAIAAKSANTILRNLLTLEDQGGNDFFGEPALDLNDFIKVDDSGCGVINILDAQKLSFSPEIYSSFLLWMLSSLYEQLPEVGDADKPKFVFFFDEAHLIFDGMGSEFLKKIEQITRLIRSKGVGLYFISQSPSDIPDDILGQLGNRIQHALRAYTPKDQKAVKVAAETFRANPEFDTADVISSLGIGEALVSVLDSEGVPGIVQKVNIVAPQSYIGPVDDNLRAELINLSEFKEKYLEPVDNESAYEILAKKINQSENIESEVPPAPPVSEEAPSEAEPDSQNQQKESPSLGGFDLGSILGGGQPAGKRAKKTSQQKTVEKAATVAANTVAREVTKGIMRGLFGQMR